MAGSTVRRGWARAAVLLGLVACSAVDPPEPIDDAFDFCSGKIHTLDLSRSERSFAKSKAWSFFPGDVDGDGVEDLVVADDRGLHFFFRPAILTEDPAIDVDAILAGEGGFSITSDAGPWEHRLAPRSGDVNGDGRDDVIVMRDDTESIVVIFSPGAGAPIDVATVGGAAPGLEIARGDGSTGWTAMIEATDVVDLDGDGMAEVVVGLSDWVGEGDYVDDLWIVPGRAETAAISLAGSPGIVHYAHAGRGSAGDIDGDGAPELVVDMFDSEPEIGVMRAPFDQLEPWRLVMATGSMIADIDGDGRSDILHRCLMWGDTCPEITGGVIFGRAWSADVDIEATSTSGFTITTAREYGSPALMPVGDVNGDGRDDLLVAPDVITPTGLVFVVFGKEDTGPVNVGLELVGAGGYGITGSVIYGDIQFGGGPGGVEAAVRGGPAGDVDGDGLADFWLATSREEEDLVVLGTRCP